MKILWGIWCMFWSIFWAFEAFMSFFINATEPISRSKMKSIIQDLDELDDKQIDALMNKLSDLKTKRNQNTEQEETLSLSDMLTKEQKTIIKSLEKQLI